MLVSCSPGSFTPAVASTLPLAPSPSPESTLTFTSAVRRRGGVAKAFSLKRPHCLFYILKNRKGLAGRRGSQPRWFHSVWIGVALSSPSHLFPFLSPSFIPPALLNKP